MLNNSVFPELIPHFYFHRQYTSPNFPETILNLPSPTRKKILFYIFFHRMSLITYKIYIIYCTYSTQFLLLDTVKLYHPFLQKAKFFPLREDKLRARCIIYA